MSTFLPKGFKNLGVSSTIATLTVVVPLVVSLMDLKPYFLFAWDPFISEWNQYWRLLILQLQFQNQSEVLLSMVLLTAKLKGLERLFGSLKLAKCLALLYIYNLIAITVVSFTAYRVLKWDLFIPSGPFGILFGLLYAHNVTTPVTYQVELCFNNVANIRPFGETVSLMINDKFGIYLLSGFLFFNEGLIVSPLVCSIGYVIGFLYFNNILPVTDTTLGFVDTILERLRIIESISTYQRIPAVAVDNFASDDEHGPEEEVDPALPPRTLGQQFLDTFR